MAETQKIETTLTVLEGEQTKPQLSQEDVAKAAKEAATTAVAEAVAAERTRASEVRALVERARLPEAQKRELADKMVKNGTTIDQARADVLEAMLACNTPVGEGTEGGTAPANDENSGYKAEYKQMAKFYQAKGMSEEEYVASRRIDDGLDTLETKEPALA